MARKQHTRHVVVGIDGSRAAVGAALWAVDEAVSRGIPLRLVTAVDDIDRRSEAQGTLDQARSALQTGAVLPRLETEIVRGSPAEVLRNASGSAAMLCVGSVGLHHFADGHVGSTAAALALGARCPVAVIRGAGEPAAATGWVVVAVDGAVEADDALALGVQEALTRRAPLRVIASSEPLIQARLDRRLSEVRHHHPELVVQSAFARDGTLDFVARNSGRMQLAIVGAHDQACIAQLIGPNGCAALHNTNCVVLIANGHRAL
jgi:nucleotide-binding universal stress UspA family protein